jgi:hypothetical protein
MTSFDRVHHQRLLDRIAQRVSDRRLLAVVRHMLAWSGFPPNRRF